MKRKNIKVKRNELRDSLIELKMEMELCSKYLGKLMECEDPEVRQVYAGLMQNIFDSYLNEIPKCIEEL